MNATVLPILKDLIECDEVSDDFESDSSDDMDIYFSTDDSETESSSSGDETPRRKLHRMKTVMETIREYDDIEFKQHFRLNRTTCLYLNGILEQGKVFSVHKFGREKICTEKALYITLWYLCNTETYRQISDRFNVTKSSVYRILTRVTNYFTKNAKKFIKWPIEDQEQVKQAFKELKGIDGVIGCIDGSHLKILKPNSEHHHLYFNRKGDYSLLLQGVCDHKKRFTDIFCGEPGSIHDSRMLRKSSIYKKGTDGQFGRSFLLGDSAYPCLNWLITPFRDNGSLTQNQKTFNYRHSATRILIENAFGRLKGRFRRLKFFDNYNIPFIVKCVITAAVLHNICIDSDDAMIEEDESSDDPLTQTILNSGIKENTSTRDEIFNEMFVKTNKT